MKTTGTKFKIKLSKTTGTTDILKRKWKINDFPIVMFISKTFLKLTCEKCKNEQKISWEIFDKLFNNPNNNKK